jgi:hypothetical protein
MRLTNGNSLLPGSGVLDVEFWKVIFHAGREVRKKLTKWFRTAVEPGDPGTRGMRIGDSKVPV